MGYNDGSWGTGQWLAMGTMMLLFWGLAIGLVVWAVRGRRNGSQTSQTSDDRTTGPDAVLAERFARGEIQEDEYLRRRELIHSSVLSRPDGQRTP